MKNFENISKSKLKEVRKLNQKKFREENRLFIIEGEKLITEALNSDWNIHFVIATDEFLSKISSQNILNKLNFKNTVIFRVTKSELEKISDTVTAQGIAAVMEQKSFDISKSVLFTKKQSFIVALDNISDAGNLGTIIRNCDWFKVDAVLLGEGTVELYNPKVVRSTMGSIFHLPIYPEVNLEKEIQEFKRNSFKIYSTVIDGSPLEETKFSKKSILILGSESHGVKYHLNKLADETISIKNYGSAESLNVAVAGGIFLFYHHLKIK